MLWTKILDLKRHWNCFIYVYKNARTPFSSTNFSRSTRRSLEDIPNSESKNTLVRILITNSNVTNKFVTTFAISIIMLFIFLKLPFQSEVAHWNENCSPSPYSTWRGESTSTTGHSSIIKDIGQPSSASVTGERTSDISRDQWSRRIRKGIIIYSLPLIVFRPFFFFYWSPNTFPLHPSPPSASGPLPSVAVTVPPHAQNRA